MKYGNMTWGRMEALINKLGGEEVVDKILSGTVEFTMKMVSYIIQTFEIVSLWAFALADGLKEAGFEWVNEAITDANFPATEFDVGNAKKDMALFHFNRGISSEDAIADMKEKGYRPATMREGIRFAIKHPKMQLEFPIVLLGQVARVGGRVGCLGRDDAKRSLYLSYFEGVWGRGYRFLAVRV